MYCITCMKCLSKQCSMHEIVHKILGHQGPGANIARGPSKRLNPLCRRQCRSDATENLCDSYKLCLSVATAFEHTLNYYCWVTLNVNVIFRLPDWWALMNLLAHSCFHPHGSCGQRDSKGFSVMVSVGVREIASVARSRLSRIIVGQSIIV